MSLKKSQLKSLVKEIFKELSLPNVSEDMTTRADLDAGTMKAVNLEEQGGDIQKKMKDYLLGAVKAFNSQDKKTFSVNMMALSKLVDQMGSIPTTAANSPMAGYDPNVKEQSSTGGVAGYATPFAFGHKKQKYVETDEEEIEHEFKNGDKVRLNKLHGGGPNSEVFTLSQWNGKKGWIGDKDNRGWFARGYQIEPADMDQEISEMSSTGAVAGYQTPFAFSKNKLGSKRAIDQTKRLGYKVVGPAPRV